MTTLNPAENLTATLPEQASLEQHLTRPFLWSLRREVWESPSLVIGPLAVAAVTVVATFVAAIRLGKDLINATLAGDRASLAIITLPLAFIAAALGVTMIVAGFLYSLDALHSERTDRSIFFWKSLPVSDTTTVLAKFAVPTLLLPAFTFVLTLATQFLTLILCTPVLLAHGVTLRVIFAHNHAFALETTLLYTLLVTTLWYAPLYAWMIFVSAWVKRAALLWAALPFFLLALFEKIAFHTRAIVELLKYRFSGSFQTAFAPVERPDTGNLLSPLTPIHFLLTPGLWIGLILAAALIFAAIRTRRYRQPL